MVLCSNCHCDIDESKMFLHQRFCIQNIKYCEQCQVGVIIEEYEEHLQSHNNNNSSNSQKLSKDESNELTLKRVQSSKIGCQYCGFLCGFGDIEEHEAMCGARSTNCKQCGKRLLIKDLKPHIEKEHKLNMENYQNMDSKSFDSSNLINNNNSNNNYNSGLYGNLANLDLKRMTTDEEIAYALALSEEDERRRQEKEKKDKEKNKYNPKVSDNFQKNNNLDMKKKPSEKIDYDELDYEYEKEMYEEEMKNFDEENK